HFILIKHQTHTLLSPSPSAAIAAVAAAKLFRRTPKMFLITRSIRSPMPFATTRYPPRSTAATTIVTATGTSSPPQPPLPHHLAAMTATIRTICTTPSPMSPCCLQDLLTTASLTSHPATIVV
nr:hypothetical protein [Tanacetum cinerariifolium]